MREERVAVVSDRARIREALDHLGFSGDRPVLAVVGGASAMDEEAARLVVGILGSLGAEVGRLGGTVLDGGTDAGIMSVLGRERARSQAFEIIGVTPRELVRPTDPVRDPVADLEPHHSATLLTPGSDFADGSSWLADTATVLAGSQPSVTLLVNGGAVTILDAEHSLRCGRRVVVLDGSGRAADEIARAARGEATDDAGAAALAGSDLVEVVPLSEPERVRRVVVAALAR